MLVSALPRMFWIANHRHHCLRSPTAATWSYSALVRPVPSHVPPVVPPEKCGLAVVCITRRKLSKSLQSEAALFVSFVQPSFKYPAMLPSRYAQLLSGRTFL